MHICTRTAATCRCRRSRRSASPTAPRMRSGCSDMRSTAASPRCATSAAATIRSPRRLPTGSCVERRTYAAAHCHPASAIRRCVEFGVRSIEHGTLIDDDTAQFVAERGAYIVPTMVVIFALVEMGKELGFPAVSQEKAAYAYNEALSGMDKMRRAGVKIGFGTDLLGALYPQQCREFTI